MTDTNPENANRHLEIMLSKSESERFRIGNELNAFGRKVLEGEIHQQSPGISEIDLKIEVLKRCYGTLFSRDEFNRIILSLKEYLLRESFNTGLEK